MEATTQKVKKHNFSAGPAILPQAVLKQAAEAVVDFNGSGLSILEVSHRGPDFAPVIGEASSLVKELLGIGDDYEVLFLTGGASSQFFMTCMNFLNADETAAYVDTGTWSTKAIKEAKLFGNIEVIASSKDQNYNYIPKGYEIPSNSKYVHFTSNNTIFGTQYKQFPDTDKPLVCDMSSDIFSRPVDTSKFLAIYAGAQKNLGPAGTTLVIVRKDALEKVNRDLPTMLNYQTHVTKGSSFNTPPVYPIYVCLLTLRWLKEQGGLTEMQKRNEDKAAILYNEIDVNPLFKGVAAKEDRSLMNATFVLNNPDLQDNFLSYAAEAGISGIKGHRSVGGLRASIYNAMPKSSIELLVSLMQDFANKYA